MKLQEYRDSITSRLEELTIMNAQQNGELSHIVETLDKIDSNLQKQNNRIRKNENTLSAITAIGGVLSLVFSGTVAWLFRRL